MRRYLIVLALVLLPAVVAVRHLRYVSLAILLVALLATFPLILYWERKGKLRKGSWVVQAASGLTGSIYCLFQYLHPPQPVPLPFYNDFTGFWGVFFLFSVVFLAIVLLGPQRVRQTPQQASASAHNIAAGAASERENQ